MDQQLLRMHKPNGFCPSSNNVEKSKMRGQGFRMDIKRLDRIAKENISVGNKLNIKDQVYYIATRGLYSQHKHGEIKLEQAKAEKEMLKNWHEQSEQPSEPIKQIVYLNKEKLVQAVILELGRYISCGMTNADREKAYPRKLFEERIVKVINEAYQGGQAV